MAVYVDDHTNATATYLVDPATGIPYVAGGGSGGGGAATIADGADVAEGATTATAYSDRTGAAAGTTIGLLKGLYATGVRIDQTTPGATNAVSLVSSGGVAATYVGDSTDGVVASSVQANPKVMARGSYLNAANAFDRARGDVNGAWSKAPPLVHSASAIVAGSITSQQLFAASAIRSKLLIQNQDAAINVFVNLGAAATAGAPCMRIAPGGSLELNGTNESVTLIAVSGTPAIAAWQF